MAEAGPAPVDVDALIEYLTREAWGTKHRQVPPREEVVRLGVTYQSGPRAVGCAAHAEGQYCCLDYFYDAVRELVEVATRMPCDDIERWRQQ